MTTMDHQQTTADSITIRYFAWVRERVGRSEDHLVLPPSVETIADLIAWLSARGSTYEEAFKHPPAIRAALDRVHVSHDAVIGRAREVGFFPPVTGG